MSSIKNGKHKEESGVFKVTPTLSAVDLTTMLIKHYDFHEGLFDLLLEFQIGVGAVPIHAKNINAPGAMVAVTGFGLAPASIKGPTTVDASEVNPSKSRSKSKVK